MTSGIGIGEFFVSLTVDAASSALTVGNVVKEFGALEISTVAEIGLLWELSVMLAKVTDAGIKASLGFEQFTMHTGLSAQELQKWQIVAEQAHASAQDVTGTVENLTKHLANLAIGIPDSSISSFAQLGVTAFYSSGKLKTAFEILDEVRQRLGVTASDAGQQERILAGLGISPNLRETLLLSQERFNALAGAAHGMTAAQEQAFDSMRGELVRIHLLAQDIGLDMGGWVAHLDRAMGILRDVEALFRGTRDLIEGKSDFLKVSPEVAARQKAETDAHIAFFRALFNPNPRDLTGREQLAEWLPKLFGNTGVALPPEPPGGFRHSAPAQVNIDKHDTYVIHDAHDPQKVKDVIERHWDETLQKKTVDGFDRQLNNGGY